MSDRKKQKTAEIINPGLGDIEKVRDILFGKYVASFEDRFSELEQRLESDIDQLKLKLVEKIASLDETVNHSLQEVNTLLEHEQSSRTKDISAVQALLDRAQTSLSHSLSLLEDQSNQDINQLKQELKEAQESIVAQLDTATSELSGQAAQQKRQLEEDKISRDTLALLLDEVAIKLRGSAE